MTVDFGKLDLSKIEWDFQDVDNNLFDYPGGYAENFSYQTAVAAQKMAARLINDGHQNDALLCLISTPIFDLRDMAIRSYKQFGDTTEIFARQFELDRTELFLAHHYLIVRDDVRPAFNMMATPRLRQGLLLIQDLGIKTSTFTNASQFYAEEVTRELNLKDCFNYHYGVDTPKNEQFAFKNTRKAIIDLLAHHKIPSYSTGYVIGETDRQMTVDDSDWSNCKLTDDTPSSLKAAKAFNFQTTLRQTSRIDLAGQDVSYIDSVTDNLGEFICHQADAIKQSRRQNNPNVISIHSQPRLTAL